MNSRQRLLKVFNFEKPDRTPITIFVTDTDIEDGPPNCVLDTRSDDIIGDLIRFHEILGIDIMLRVSVDVFEPIAFDRDSDDWLNSWHLSDDRKRLTHTITTPDGQLRETFNLEGERFHSDPRREWMKLRNVRVEPLVKSEHDLELIRKYRPSIGGYNFEHIKQVQDRLGDRGVVLPRVPSSVFNSAFGLRKLEDLFTDPVLRPGLYEELMEFCLSDVIEVGRQIARAGGDVMRVVGNVANSGMVGPGFYREHILPYEKRYIDALTAEGCKVLFHNCGKCSSLLEVYREMLDGEALESLSTPGSGGDITDLRTAREKLGERIVMVGNFDQVHLLKDGTPEEIRAQVYKIFEQTRGDKSFIFSTSDSIIPGTTRENIEAMVEAAFECVG